MESPSLRLLTFNAGLLNINLFGFQLFQPAPYVKERLLALPEQLRKSDADIIALQEIYSLEQKKWLADQLRQEYYNYYVEDEPFLKLPNSLMLLSRYPIINARHHLFQRATFTEELADSKGLLRIIVKTPDFGKIAVVNIHATSGGAGTFNDELKALRQQQFHKAMRFASNDYTPQHIIMGDFNASPYTETDSYTIFLEGGYQMALPEGQEAELVTWAPDNPLNQHFVFRGETPRQLDHVLLSEELQHKLHLQEIKLCFTQACVSVGAAEQVPLSDHYGLLATYSLTKAQKPKRLPPFQQRQLKE
jgi:endonuclease/exonuclease/phosphatase family metal-dependent hydrolase